ncbi:MAG: PilZ domain-containing protein [Syntrophorhabdaceae bacterium]
MVDVGYSIIHEASGDRLIVAQTDPPISRSRLGTEIFVTFLEKGEGEARRFGFAATVIEFIKDFELSSSAKVQAVMLKVAGDFEEYNLRMFYRLEPPGNCGITIGLNGKSVNLIDISIGGARFSFERIPSLKPNDVVALSMVIENSAYPVEAKVLRIWEPDNERLRKTVEMASVQFIDMQPSLKNILARKIRDVEREMRYKEIGEG